MGESTRERITPNILIFTYPIYTSTVTYIPWALNVAYLLPTLSSISSFISIGLLGCYTALFTLIKLFVLFITMISGFTRRTSTSHIFISSKTVPPFLAFLLSFLLSFLLNATLTTSYVSLCTLFYMCCLTIYKYMWYKLIKFLFCSVIVYVK